MRTICGWDFEFPKALIPAVSTAGTPYQRSVAVGMPRISPDLLRSAFYLYPTVEAAKKGDRFGGTGFFLGYPTEVPEAPVLLYAVTNWHVAVRDGCSVMRVNTAGGGIDIFELDPSEWEFPPGGHDLAILPFQKINLQDAMHDVVALHLSMFLTKEEIGELGIGPGENIVMIGRFVDHDGAASNIPAARFGNISVMPQAIEQPTGAKKLKSFILDVHSRTGYSGSPVFVYRTFGSDLTTDQIVLSNLNLYGTFNVTPEDHFIKLLGIHWGQFPEQWEIKSKKKTVAQASIRGQNKRYVEGMSGMTLAVPAWAIREFLEMPKYKKPRDKKLEEVREWAKSNRGPVAESSPPPNDANPNHQEDFRRLVGAAAQKREQED